MQPPSGRANVKRFRRVPGVTHPAIEFRGISEHRGITWRNFDVEPPETLGRRTVATFIRDYQVLSLEKHARQNAPPASACVRFPDVKSPTSEAGFAERNARDRLQGRRDHNKRVRLPTGYHEEWQRCVIDSSITATSWYYII